MAWRALMLLIENRFFHCMCHFGSPRGLIRSGWQELMRKVGVVPRVAVGDVLEHA